MTNKEALLAQSSTLQNVTDASINFYLEEQSLNGSGTYVSANRQQIDMALAGLLFVLCTSPKSVSELDFTLTQQDVSSLLKLRSSLFAKWDVIDPAAKQRPTITGRSPW